MKKRFISLLLLCSSLFLFTGCDITKEDVQHGVDVVGTKVEEGIEIITSSEIYNNVKDFVVSEGVELSEKACNEIQSYLKRYYEDIQSIDSIQISSSKRYSITFTDENNNSHSVEFEYDGSTDSVTFN